MSTIKQVRRIVCYFIFAMLVLLGGCGTKPFGISDQTTRPKHFDLFAPKPVSNIDESTKSQVFVMKPKVNQALGEKKIALVTKDNQISYFTDWYWSDDLASLIQAKIVEVFGETHVINNKDEKVFKGVGTLGQGINTDYRIVTEINAFQFEERIEDVKARDCIEIPRVSNIFISDVNSDLSLTSQGELNTLENNGKKEMVFWAIVEISVKIIYERKGEVIASKSYCSEMIVDSKKVERAVDGLNIVLGEVLEKITQNTVIEINKHRKEFDSVKIFTSESREIKQIIKEVQLNTESIESYASRLPKIEEKISKLIFLLKSIPTYQPNGDPCCPLEIEGLDMDEVNNLIDNLKTLSLEVERFMELINKSLDENREELSDEFPSLLRNLDEFIDTGVDSLLQLEEAEGNVKKKESWEVSLVF